MEGYKCCFFQDDGENPICVIAYTDEFKDVMNYFRAILQKDERSQRAFDLTSEVLEQNAANYTAWYFRRVLLEHLKLDLKQELEFVSQVGDENQKNYQIWYHRKVIIEKTNDYSTELKYTGEHIRLEPKNYHAWAHRQWVIQTYNLWEEDMKFVEELIELDFRNNSAWNQRYFLITKNKTIKLTNEIRKREIEYALSYCKKAPSNESPWAYIKGLYFGERFSNFPELYSAAEDFSNRFPMCAHSVSLQIDCLEDQGTTKSYEQAITLLTKLKDSLDNIHKKYWSFRIQLIEKKMSK